ncbi:metallophosphatase [Salinimicrobium sp. GXAS 041]|uniref:metallophosphatase n=1 Tax=Salinimicrobium sp. GXAS 041 TaxID=3400806 RepID=UPI003C793B0F
MQPLKTCFLIVVFLLCCPAFSQEQVSHTFYISANTGVSKKNNSEAVLKAISEASQNDTAASLILVGNSTTKDGFPAGEEAREAAKEYLRKNLLEQIKNFNGKTIFTPGVFEWNKAAPQSIDDLESFLQDNSNSYFWPNDGCPLESEEINDEIVLITVDSQWFLENWDDHPQMNVECEIRDREELFIQFKDDLKDNFGKTKIVAIHHPVLSNSSTGFVDKIGGFTPQSFQHTQLKSLRKRLETLASLYDDVIFVSGNHPNLQFLNNDRNAQIISGAAAETLGARASGDAEFASDKAGFAKLEVFKDGKSKVSFFEVNPNGTSLLFSKSIERQRPRLEDISFEPEKIGPTKLSSIYTPEETNKSGLHKWIWGNNYRDLYSTQIEAPVLNIDTIAGNLRPLKEGGGQQSRSLRFIGENDHEYTIRALRKSPIRFLQANVAKENYIGDFLENTTIERSLADFYTTAHPYAPFAISPLSDEIDLYHVKPQIYYIQKQESLGIHNLDYGDELYMLEPHVGDENKNVASFGKPDDIISTKDMLLEIREDKDARVDEKAYIKARLFDMMVGDWDRHQDQWRWSMFEQENGNEVYYPIARDRDQAFSKYDGALIALVKLSMPNLRKMQSYKKNIKNLKRFNWSGYPLDQSFIRTATWEDWKGQVEYLQRNLTDEVIESSFAELPDEIKGQNIENIKSTLKYRRDHLLETAEAYYEYLNEFDVVIGTDEDDVFEITRSAAGKTSLRITTEGEEIFSRQYDEDETDEIWLYGLSGEDKFITSGEGEDLVKIKVLGGPGEDLYDFSNPKKIKLYDYKSTKSTITNSRSNKLLVDSYDINRFDYEKRKYQENKILPYVDFVPDAGFSMGLRNVFTTYGIKRNPFTTQHRAGANYYFSTNGYELDYSAEFAHVFYNWNFGIEGRYTSPNYFLNYFGTGNNTTYDRDAVEKDYNRVKLQQWRLAPSLIWHNKAGSSFYLKPMIEAKEVSSNQDDFIEQVFSSENDIFDNQLYAGAEVNYNFLNKNNSSYPSLGMEFDATTGYKRNIDEHHNKFGYVESSFSFDYPLIPSGFAVIASKIGGEAIFGDDYEFYHAATIGGNENLRGYRNHRFNGKQAFYHSTDVRSAFALVENEFIPIILGVSAGFDYGRVWSELDTSNRWHHNYGGSFWINAMYAVTGQVGLYNGEDGTRLTFALNFKY